MEGTGSIPAGHHRLERRWAFWYQKKKRSGGSGGAASWFDGIACLGSFGSVEGFWEMYSHLLRPDTLGGGVDVMLFREGVQPMWEDPANAKGGKFTMKCRKGIAAVMWEELVRSQGGKEGGGGGGLAA
jgi:translation initiation factor 4E